jgi:hypothetical protein
MIPLAEFERMLAEAAVNLGRDAVENVLAEAAEDYGWPIPPHARSAVALILKILCQMEWSDDRTYH